MVLMMIWIWKAAALALMMIFTNLQVVVLSPVVKTLPSRPRHITQQLTFVYLYFIFIALFVMLCSCDSSVVIAFVVLVFLRLFLCLDPSTR